MIGIQFTPWEIYIHFGQTLIALYQGSYVVVLICLPLFLYDLNVLVNKKYKVYALFRKDYKDMQRNKTALLVKSVYNAVYCLITLLKQTRIHREFRFIFSLTFSHLKDKHQAEFLSDWLLQ